MTKMLSNFTVFPDKAVADGKWHSCTRRPESEFFEENEKSREIKALVI